MAQVIAGLLQTTLDSSITAGNTQDFSIPGLFGGADPKAVLIAFSRSVSLNTRRAHAAESYGFADGTNQRMVAWLSRDGQTTSETKRALGSTSLICELAIAGNSVDGLASWNSWIPDGVRINIDNQFSQDWQIGVRLFGGADLQADVFEALFSGTIGGTVVITDPGFPPDLMFWLAGSGVFTTGPTVLSGARLSRGICATDGTTFQHIAHSRADRNGVTTTEVGAVGSETRMLHKMIAGSPTWNADYEVTARSATGVTVTTRRENSAMIGVCLALGLGGGKVWAGRATTPTVLGTQTVVQSGLPTHKPRAVFVIGSGFATNQTLNNANAAGTGCVGMSADGNDADEFSVNPISRDNVSAGGSECGTYSQGDFVHVRDAVDLDAYQSTIQNDPNGKMNLDGFDHEFTNVQGEGAYVYYATIEGSVPDKAWLLDGTTRRNPTRNRRI